MTRRNLALLLAIISFICLGFIAQANFFITKINAIERENSNLSAENTSKEQQIQELEERNRALEEELQTKIVYFEEEEILAKLLWCEARNQSWEGQVYTCSAILNYCERNNTSIWDAAHNINSFNIPSNVKNISNSIISIISHNISSCTHIAVVTYPIKYFINYFLFRFLNL